MIPPVRSVRAMGRSALAGRVRILAGRVRILSGTGLAMAFR